MKTVKVLILSFLAILLISNTADASVIDSVGTEVIDGKVIILHKVLSKETLYSIKTKYKVTISEITTLNPGAEMGLQIGQLLKIPTHKTIEVKTTQVTIVSEIKPENTNNSDKIIKYHTVKPGETIYGVSKLYPCSITDIKKWNNLTSNALSVGQLLQINDGELIETESSNVKIIKEQNKENGLIKTSETKEIIDTIKVEETIVEEEVFEKIDTKKEEISETPIIDMKEEIIEEKTAVKVVENEILEESKVVIQVNNNESDSIPSTKTVDMGGYSKIFEKGFAELIKDTDTDERYLAHHRTLPEGTILQIKNLANGKSVFVRIVGSFENEDSKVIIQLSKKAEIRLQTESEKFLTEISYIP